MGRYVLAALALQAVLYTARAQGMAVVPVDSAEPEAPPQELTGEKDPMTELLHWAIENSDPETLKNLTARYKEQNLTTKDVYGQDVIDAFFRNEADIMKEQIAVIQDFRNSSLPESHIAAALEELEEQLHQVDHAGNLRRMGGMQPILDLALGSERTEQTRTLALWALGVAVQNNAPAQKDLYELGGLQLLAAQLPYCSGEAHSGEASAQQFCAKLLFTLSGLLKNSPFLQAEADKVGVTDWMVTVGFKHSSAAVVKKALGYLDILLAQNPEVAFLERAAATPAALAAPLLELVRGASRPDADTSEKALAVFSHLAALRPRAFGQFAKAVQDAAQAARRDCESSLGAGDEVCVGLEESAAEVYRKLSQAEAASEL